jgi:hypothetical protein
MRHAAHGKGLHPAINAYLQRRFQEWLAEDASRRQNQLAALLEVTPAHISGVVKNGKGAGAELEAAAARLFGIGVDELRRRAHAEWKGNDTVLVLEDRYPNRAKAVEFMRSWVRPGAIAKVQTHALQSDTDPDPKWWADLIEAEDRLLRLDEFRPERVKEREQRAVVEGDEMEKLTQPKKKRSTK